MPERTLQSAMDGTQYPETFPVRLTSQMYKQAKRAADREDLSISAWMRKLIREALAKEHAK